MHCYLDAKLLELLWDTGAQVCIVFEGFLKSQLSSVQIQHVEQLLGFKVLLVCKQQSELISHIVGGQRLV